MGEARNLKLKSNGGKNQGTGGGNNFFVWGQLSTLFSCCVHYKYAAQSGDGGSPCSVVRGQSPLKLKHF